MAAGNASNTVFTAIPVGEDFYMSFSTERFHRTIAPQDFTYINFKLYDARIIGSTTSPNPNALILEYNNQPNTDYSNNEDFANPNGRPSFFKISPRSVSVFVASQDLDEYEQTKTGDSNAVFRGEIYGFVEAVVAGDETKFARLNPAPINVVSRVGANLFDMPASNTWWDGYFFREDVRRVTPRLRLNSPALGAFTGTL
jgi:hypothetical protein